MDFDTETQKLEDASGSVRRKLLRKAGLEFDEHMTFESVISDAAFDYLMRVVFDPENANFKELVHFVISLETEFHKLSQEQRFRFLDAMKLFCSWESCDINRLALADLIARQYSSEMLIEVFKSWSSLNPYGKELAILGCETLIRMRNTPSGSVGNANLLLAKLQGALR